MVSVARAKNCQSVKRTFKNARTLGPRRTTESTPQGQAVCASRDRGHARAKSEASHETFGQGQNLAPERVSAPDPSQPLFPPPHCAATIVRIVSTVSPTRAAFTTGRPAAPRTASGRGRTHPRAGEPSTGIATTGRERTTVASTRARTARGRGESDSADTKACARVTALAAVAHAARVAPWTRTSTAARSRTG